MRLTRLVHVCFSLAFALLAAFLVLKSAQTSMASTFQYDEDFTDYTYKASGNQAVWDIWTHQVRLAKPNANLNSASAFYWLDAGVFSDGSTLVVWADSRTGSQHIYAQKLDTRGNRQWQKDIQVDSSEAADYPSLAIGPDDIAYIVFQAQGPEYGLCFQKINESGQRLLDVDVYVGDGMGFIASGNSNLYVSWSIMTSTGTTISLQKLDTNGGPLWSQPITISGTIDTGTGAYPQVAVDSSGNAILAWRGNQNLFAQKVSPLGDILWSQPAQVNLGTYASVGYFTMGTDHSGNAIFAWDGDSQGRAQKLSPAGAPVWASDVPIAGVQPWDLTIGPDDSVAIVYLGGTTLSKLDPNGTPVWTVQLAKASTSFNDYPAVAVDGNNQIHGAWLEGADASGEIFASAVSPSGLRLWEEDSRVTYDDGVANQTLPSLAAGPGGSAWVAWQDKRSLNPRIYAQRLDAQGNRLWKTEIWVDRQDQPLAGVSPFIVSGPISDTAFVVWKAAPLGATGKVFIQSIDANGNLQWANPVAWGNSGPGRPAAVVDAAGRLWLARTENRQVWLQRFNPDGSFAWVGDRPVNLDSSRTVTQPSIGIDAQGNVLVAWTANTGSDLDIVAQAVDANGQTVWSQDLNVNANPISWPGSDIYARIASGSDQGWSIFWVAEDVPLNPNLYGQMISLAGQKLWNNGSDRLVDASHPFANTGFEAVAQPGGDIQIGINTNSYYRCLDLLDISSTGEKLHSGEICSAREALYPTIMPVGTHVWAAWQDAAKGDWSIMADLLTPEELLEWKAPLPLIPLEDFTFESGSVESENVNTSGQDVEFANLTAETNLNGGQASFYLSNTGGSSWMRITPGHTEVFTTTGSDLRWRVDLGADPLWPRSPTVEHVKIAYGNSLNGADDYEPDDLCDLAQPIEANGMPQLHTLPTGDQDWVRLDVPAASQYMANVAGDISSTIQPTYQMEVKLDCLSDPILAFTQTSPTSTDLLWRMQEPGTAYLHVQAQDEATGSAGYQLSVRKLDPAPVAVVAVSEASDPSIQDSYNLAGDLAYRTILTTTGMTKDHILYLSPGPDRDSDGNGAMDDIYGPPSASALRWAIEDWSNENGLGFGQPFYLVLVGDGQAEQYLPLSGIPVSSEDLNLWLTNLEATTGADQLNLILDYSYSGSMIEASTGMSDTVSGQHRTIVSSAGANQLAHFGSGISMFGSPFFKSLADGQSIYDAFQSAGSSLYQAGIDQTPWLDDNGDAIPSPWTPPASNLLKSLGSGPIRDGDNAHARGLNLMDKFNGTPGVSTRYEIKLPLLFK